MLADGGQIRVPFEQLRDLPHFSLSRITIVAKAISEAEAAVILSAALSGTLVNANASVIPIFRGCVSAAASTRGVAAAA
jgi:hypothetical protein